MRNSLVVLVLLVAAACMSGCAVSQPQTKVVVETPPDSLLQDCQHAPRPADNTVNGLLLAVVNERGVTESCDWADKAALRAWKAGVSAASSAK